MCLSVIRLTLYIAYSLAMLCLVLLSSCSVDERPPLTASYTVSETSGDSSKPPYTVSVDGAQSTGNIVSYNWDFGDGTNLQSGLKVSHRFMGFGDFKVTLIVTDDNADTRKITKRIPVGYSISGTITSQPGSVVDSDVNDPLASYATNNTAATAQAVPNPAVIGGFASGDGTNRDPGVNSAGDRFEVDPDIYDVYSVTLTANQTIALSISNFNSQRELQNDLDLFLFDFSNKTHFESNSCEFPVDAVVKSISSLSVENVVVPVSGEYYIVVCGFNGHSNYVLTIGNTSVLNAGNVLSVQDEFVPGDVIVKFKEALAETPGVLSYKTAYTAATIQSRAASLGMVAKAGQPGNAMLFNLGNEKQKELAFSTLGIAGRTKTIKNTNTAENQLKADTIEAIKALRLRADVLSADLNYIRHPFAIPSDPEYASDQWHFPLIKLPNAWDLVIADSVAPTSNVVVAVIDTGVVLIHPDLVGKLVPGYDFVTSFAFAIDGDGQDPDPDDPGDDGRASVFHGTHVTGTITALSDNGLGVAGVTWNTNTKVMPVRALGAGGGTSFDIMDAVRYAAGLDKITQPQPAKAAEIINLSLGGGRYSQFEQDIFTEVRNAGVIVVAAAGNSKSDVPNYPASYDGVISVSAVTKKVLGTKTLASYSNFGSFIDIAAPGGDGGTDGVRSTSATIDIAGNRIVSYRHLTGTSMAAPHVSGVAALMKSVYPNLTPLEFDILLESGSLTTDLSADGAGVRNDNFGFGLVDAEKAVNIAKLIQANGSISLPPFLSVGFKSMFFLDSDTNITLTTQNEGGGSFVLDAVSSDALWLSVTSITIDPVTKLGSYSVSVDRTGLANAQYQGMIKIDYSGDITGSTIVPVIMQVGPLSTVGDTGFQYVDLIDDIDSSFVGSTLFIGEPTNGLYDYRFNGVKPGRYQIRSFSDLNNENLRCVSGEACGTQPRVTVSNEDRVNVNFGSRFGDGLGTLIKRESSSVSKALPQALFSSPVSSPTSK